MRWLSPGKDGERREKTEKDGLSSPGHLFNRSFAGDLWVCMGLLIAQNHFEQFRAPIKIIRLAQNNSRIPVPVRLKQIIETEGHTDMTNTTPGFDFRLTIRIKADKNGKRRATYWSMRTMRNLPLKIDDADFWLATEQADLCPSIAT